jgi:hypothetical protein
MQSDLVTGNSAHPAKQVLMGTCHLQPTLQLYCLVVSICKSSALQQIQGCESHHTSVHVCIVTCLQHKECILRLVHMVTPRRCKNCCTSIMVGHTVHACMLASIMSTWWGVLVVWDPLQAQHYSLEHCTNCCQVCHAATMID